MANLFAFLSDAASKGAPCPNNTHIQDIFDLPSVSEVNPLFIGLETDGLIVVERTGNRRRVTIVATGASTAWTEYYRGRPRLIAGVAGPGDSARPIEGFRGDLPPERYLHRDPCPRCGVRADVGCRHSVRMAA